jgi:phosphorylcholine metabolism protein LicD
MGRARIDEKDIAGWMYVKTELFKDVLTLFEKYELKYWLDGGTLLGLVRDDSIMPHDSDHDFCIKVEDVNDKFFLLIDELYNDPKYDMKSNDRCHKYHKDGFNNGSLKPMKGLFGNYYQITYAKKFESKGKEKDVYCDLFIVFPFEDFYFYKLSLFNFRFKKEHIEECKTIKKYGHDIRIPKMIDEYLDVQYTEQWRIPDKFNPWKTKYWHSWETAKSELPKDYSYTFVKNETNTT